MAVLAADWESFLLLVGFIGGVFAALIALIGE